MRKPEFAASSDAAEYCGDTAESRFKRTMDSRHSFPTAPNVLNRNFDVDAPNKVWTVNICYVWTYEGWLYLAVVMDLFNREIVGWAMDKRMKRQFVLDALAMAYWQRKLFATHKLCCLLKGRLMQTLGNLINLAILDIVPHLSYIYKNSNGGKPWAKHPQ